MSVHARLDKPLSLRKDILECALRSADALQSVEHLQEYAREKKELKTQLKKQMGELKKMINAFDKDLPTVPKESNMVAKRDEIRSLMLQETMQEMGGAIKPVQQVKEELEKLKKRHPKVPKKKVRRVSEREKMRRELETIRGRIEKLKSITPKE